MKRSVLIAFGILVAIGLYLLSGLIFGKETREEATAEESGPRLMTVRIRELAAEDIPREIVLVGKSEASRSVDLRGEIEGRVTKVILERGRFVKAGDLVAQIELRDRPERLSQAKAVLAQVRLEHESAKRLFKTGLRSEVELARSEAVLRGAEQVVRGLEIELEKTRIIAPFDGFLEERDVEEGDFVRVGERIARVLDLDPLLVVAEATEFQRPHLKVGEVGHARFATGEALDGTLRYVGSEADSGQRTFTVELEVANPDGAISAGYTAELAVETERVAAYRISPALISISDNGTFGIKVVDEDNIVRFYEADLVKASPDYIWVTGLPDRVRLITFGQGFVKEGDLVEVDVAPDGWD